MTGSSRAARAARAAREASAVHAARAQSFNAVAAQYAGYRPSYPPALLDAIEEQAGRPLAGARVVDVGAGTGISTALLAARGARVIAVEPGAGMAAELHRALPGVPLVRGDGNALPLAGASADLVTYAQSWHWTDPARSLPEAMRVLRPGGTLALWWNVPDHAIAWQADQRARIEERFGSGTGAHGTAGRVRDSGADLDFAHRQVRWSRRLPLDDHLAGLGSHSIFLVHDRAAVDDFFAGERERLNELFPAGTVEETYVVDLLTASRPPS
ncbi:class I SAM-dependent methyltransferase [Streptomyces sp. TS71-3]|uniref:class I SAM-dependent methyltransferase n=1 Tax=Streptomyces sp. TS71-3 TaxID=2733862 RepID=UPI001AFCDEA3|nr:class I SAM-dependent methyltransferase [Streptomyces sp. TS71-3]GHJ34730.1 methyltransferase [Streptomyces sp. TS71-3]